MSKRPMRNDPGLGRVGVPAVTGAQDRLSCAEGNGAAVDFRGDVTRSEGVVLGHVLARFGRGLLSAPLRRDRPTIQALPRVAVAGLVGDGFHYSGCIRSRNAS